MHRIAVGFLLWGLVSCSSGQDSSLGEWTEEDGVAVFEFGELPVTLPSLETRFEERVELILPEGETFHRVRGAARTSSGVTFVADAGNHRILTFGPDGGFLGSGGREGDGPGEFRLIRDLYPWRSDSVGVWDGLANRFSVLDGEANFVRTVPFETQSDRPVGSVYGTTADGRILVAGYLEEPTGATGTQWPNHPIYLFGPDGAFLTDLGTAPEREAHYDLNNGGVSRWVFPFHRRGFQVTHGEGLVLANSESFEIRMTDLNGSVRTIVRQVGGSPSDDFDVPAWKSELLAGVPPERRARMNQVLHNLDYPVSPPAFSDLRTDSDLNIWVREGPSSGQMTSRRWLVFDRTGSLASEAVIRPGLRVLVFGTQTIVAVTTDELGIERVFLVPLSKSVSRP